MPDAGNGGREACLTVRTGSEILAIRAARVRGVAKLPELARVPGAPPSLAGLAKIEGAVLPVVDLARLLGRDGSRPTRMILFDGEAPCGLLVDEVGAITAGEADRSDEIDCRLVEEFRVAAAPRPSFARRSEPVPPHIPANELSLLGVLVGRQEFALPLAQIDAVRRVPHEIGQAVGAGAAVLGTTTHRHRRLPLLSLSALLALPSRPDPARQRIVVAMLGPQRVVLLVDAIGHVLRVGERFVDPVPAVLRRGHGDARIQAICRLEDGRRLVSVLSVEHLAGAALAAFPLPPDEAATDDAGLEKEQTRADEPFLVFTVGGRELALPVAAVAEITALPDSSTRLFRSSPFVRRVVNLRGQVLPVVEPGWWPDTAPGPGTARHVIVAASGGLRAAFLVDAVAGLVRVPPARIEAAPWSGRGGAGLVERVAVLEAADRALPIVSPQAMMARVARDLTPAPAAALP